MFDLKRDEITSEWLSTSYATWKVKDLERKKTIGYTEFETNGEISRKNTKSKKRSGVVFQEGKLF
jgi:hypothetical protein